MVPFPSIVALLRPRGPRGRVPLSRDKPSWPRQISTSGVEGRGGRSKVVVVARRIARALLAEFTQTPHSFLTPANRFPQEESELNANMSNWLNFRRLDFVPASGGDPVCG